ncbi:cell filamentation protein Fic [bacterium (Candidatus Gribaldobacteria) CG10_big_fil_rev_8_21_14_0_10_37_46]|uniref:Cell filamentation protein Fic n=1 Tax=bacterium (Candidatus Gribaldobacteria) CG10_big_fil_rev_8_21_14_0_10_37_46 TaxID=2014276 RepID=A0A2H0UXD3_9BACT|nr:MAG: cell filamentation protein Fic [bacterium (Candidatus Gribaldobacteria) CG10_big_fil_rev_8_21_14_0_10_37_46]
MPETQIIIYEAENGKTRIEVRFENENVWLTQKLMAELFECSVDNISLHLKNIFSERELDPNSVTEEYSITATDRKQYKTKRYSLEAIIAVGYRVNSNRGTQFRQWATERLKEYIIKGFALDDVRLKQGGYKSRYFEELLQRIRDIRSSERMLYQKVTDIYTTSIDYRKDAKETDLFFKTVQNKMHYAVTGKTASELIAQRASHTKQNMGLTNFPGTHPIKRDIYIAKNYLDEKELKLLNHIVDAYLSFAEIQAQSEKAMKMTDWTRQLDEYLRLMGKGVLKHSGSVSAVDAETKADLEFTSYKREQDKNYISDFDLLVKKMLKHV